MKNLFRKITPVSILTSVGLTATIVSIIVLLISQDKGELGTGLLSIVALILYFCYLIDRYLVKKVSYRKLILTELILILLFPVLYLCLHKETKLYIETNRPYYILVYSDVGITKEQIKRKGLADHCMTIKKDSIIFLNYNLYNDKNFIVIDPKNWNGHKAKRLDTIINAKRIIIEMYSNHVTNEVRDSIFKKNVTNIILTKMEL